MSYVPPTQEQWDTFFHMGDLNRDGYIDNADVATIQMAEANNDLTYDLNHDGVVNIYDVITVTGNLRLDIWTYFGLIPPAPYIVEAAAQTIIANQVWINVNIYDLNHNRLEQLIDVQLQELVGTTWTPVLTMNGTLYGLSHRVTLSDAPRAFRGALLAVGGVTLDAPIFSNSVTVSKAPALGGFGVIMLAVGLLIFLGVLGASRK